jgi:hypothetical protein
MVFVPIISGILPDAVDALKPTFLERSVDFERAFTDYGIRFNILL